MVLPVRHNYLTGLTYRRTDADGDMLFGASPSVAFSSDLEAMSDVLKTRLAAVDGEWWEGDYGALPYFSDILGAYATDENREIIDLMVIARIMDTVGVLSVSDVESSIQDRHYSFRCKVQTVYGETKAEINA